MGMKIEPGVFTMWAIIVVLIFLAVLGIRKLLSDENQLVKMHTNDCIQIEQLSKGTSYYYDNQGNCYVTINGKIHHFPF